MNQSGQSLNFQEKLRYVGSLDQLYSVRRLALQEGPGDGMRLIEVCTAAGLRAVFCESRALDLYELHFRGINLGFLSKNGLIGGRVPGLPGEFTHTWPGGFLVTCGLRNTGPSSVRSNETHPTHGRIAGISAERVCIDLDQGQGSLVIRGQMRESALFGPNLVLHRRIEIPLQGSAIFWQDTIENQAAEAEPVFLLYHFNFGYPFLAPALQLHFPPGQVMPRTADAQKGLAEFDQICGPVDGYAEQVFFHKPMAAESPEHTVRLSNPELGLSAALTFNSQELPNLIEWKSMKSGDYALGLEPSSSLIQGCSDELAGGYDQILPGFSSREIHLALNLS